MEIVTKLLRFQNSRFLVKPSLQKYFASIATQRDPSYFHKRGPEPLKYLTIGQLLSQAATKFPDREALISCSENSRITFAETLEKANRLASGLLSLGLSRGDRVAIFAPNYEFWYISMFAIARAGLICVSMNPAFQVPELDFCINKVDVKAIIAPESFRNQKFYEMLAALQGKENSLENLIIHSERKLPGAIQFNVLMNSSSVSDVAEIEKLQDSIPPDSGCNIQFSSGTTGQPKAALLSHFNKINNAVHVGLRQELDKNYRRICLNNPFFHVYGTVIAILNALHFGSTLVLPAPHFSPEDSLKTIVKENCDVIYGTPTMFVDLVAKQRELKLDLPEAELGCTGGAICTPKLVHDMQSFLRIKKVQAVYGLTETSAVVFQTNSTDDIANVQEFVGQVSDNTEAKVVDKDGNAVPFGQPGELCIRGYCTMLGYWNDEEKTRECLSRDNWFKTGDQFILYENGYGKIIGRFKEMISRGGENIFPREIEDFLNTHPNILENHVIGIPEERWGEEVGAFVRLKNNTKPLTRKDVKDFCKGKLSHFKIPRHVVIVNEFPRTLSGKIQKFKFLDVFQEEFKASLSDNK